MRAWSVAMIQPAVRVSGMFTNEETLSVLLNGDPVGQRKLETNLHPLEGCSKRVTALGIAPPRFSHARAAALTACSHIEAGAGLVDAGLGAAHGGLGAGLLQRAASELSTGVDGIGRVNTLMPTTPSRSGAAGNAVPRSPTSSVSNTVSSLRALDQRSHNTANVLLRKWGSGVDRRIKVDGCVVASPAPRCLADSIDWATSQLVSEMPRLRPAGRDYLAEQILEWAKDEARRLPALPVQMAYLRMYAGAITTLDRLADGFQVQKAARPEKADYVGAGHGVRMIKAHLVVAGYEVAEQAVGSARPIAQSAVMVRSASGVRVDIYVYSTSADASMASKALFPIEKSNPNQIAVEVIGPDIYVGTVEEPAHLPRTRFEKVVVTAEGL